MEVLTLMILCSISLALIFLLIFIFSVKSGQFEGGESPAVRMLIDDEKKIQQTDKIDTLKIKKTS